MALKVRGVPVNDQKYHLCSRIGSATLSQSRLLVEHLQELQEVILWTC